MEVDNLTYCTEEVEPMSELGMLTLLHLAKYGDEKAKEELERRKTIAQSQR